MMWVRSAGHYSAAEGLAERGSPDPFNDTMSGSIHLLIGFSFELALKAAYMIFGGDSEMLRKFNHDLTKTLKAARKRGFAFGHKRLEMLIDALRDTHADHYFRYGTATNVTLPTLEESLPMLRELVNEVGREGVTRGVITNMPITQ